MSNQKTLDSEFDRLEREAAFRAALLECLPVKPGVRRVLRTLYALTQATKGTAVVETVKTIAKAAGTLPAAARSNLQRAAEDGWVVVDLCCNGPNTYRLQWGRMFAAAGHSARALLEASGLPKPEQKGTYENERGGTPESARGGLPISRGGDSRFRNPLHEKSNELKKFNSGGSRGEKSGSWAPFAITIDVLRDPAKVQEIYLEAVRREWLPECDSSRQGVFACAVQASSKGQDAARLFTWLIRRKSWNDPKRVSEASDEAGRRMIVQLDRRDAPEEIRVSAMGKDPFIVYRKPQK